MVSINVTLNVPIQSGQLYAVALTPEGSVTQIPFVSDKTSNGFVIHVYDLNDANLGIEWTATPNTQ
jgi:hypothetical protein